MLKGVNLGNWLVLEKWMSPELFSGTSAEDEIHLWRALSETAAGERFKVNRDSWVTDRDYVYRDAYERIRAKAPEVTVVFHDGFRIEEWKGYFTVPEFENVVLDTHLYLMMLTMSAGDRELDEYLAFVADRFADTVREAAKSVPVMIGEWCLDTASKESFSLTDGERSTYFRAIADAQLRAWEPAVAWTYWSYKLHTTDRQHDPWDMGRAIELRWLPEELAPPAG